MNQQDRTFVLSGTYVYDPANPPKVSSGLKKQSSEGCCSGEAVAPEIKNEGCCGSAAQASEASPTCCGTSTQSSCCS